jgi:hypothetical protein
MATHLQVIHGIITVILFVIAIRNYYSFKKTLSQYGKIKGFIFPMSVLGLLNDVRDAKTLIKELGNSPDAKILKNALRRADISIFSLFSVFLSLAILFMAISE